MSEQPSRVTTAEEGAEALLMALLVAYDDLGDEETLPLRRILQEVGRECGVELLAGDVLRIPEEITVVEFRERTRIARAGLARGDKL